WVFYYVLIIFVLIHSVRLIRHSIFAIGVLVLVLGVQLYDYRSLLGTEKLPHFGRYKVPLSESKWKGLFEKLDKFEFYPPMQTDYVTPGDYMYFSYLAADYAKPINLGYAARLDNKSVAEYTADIRERINLGDVGENELFISTRENLERFIVPYQQRKLRIGELDGYYFLFPAKMIGDPAFAQFSDAAPEEIKIRRTFTECQAPSAHAERNWRMQVHTLERSKSAIFLRASMPKDSTIGKSDFFVLLLSRDNKAFVSPPVVFSEDSVLGTGFLQFQGTYFTEGLKPGNYRVALMTESSVAKARNETFCYFGNLNVELKEVYKPYEAPDVGKMKWWLESIDASNEIITIGGWAFLSGQSSFPNRVELLFRSESKTYAVPTDPVLRPDVTTFFNNPFNIGTCGFISRIDKSLLESGKYEIGIRIVNDASGMDVIDYTNREFTVQ
ncbi:MAG TPA: hypothetical protein VG737_10900, partial [Cyclobacteriaceae bacterium]|nr:hypothetical protein [Cyclobacteriaceae bacterium]